MPSRRVPSDTEPNPWSRAFAAARAAARFVDLTETNPTRVGLPGPGPEALAALTGPAALGYAPDPRGSLAAREAIAGYYAERGARVAAEDLVLTASTSEAYAHLFRLLANPGDVVLAPSPSYPLLQPIAALESVVLAAYAFVYEGRWRLDQDSLEAAVTPTTRAIVVVQPNNPTGSCLAPDELERIETLCERHQLTLISDEVFGDFAWAPGERPLPSLAGRGRVPTLVLSGLSKVAGLPQMKLGWIAVSGPEPDRSRLLEGLDWIADLFLSVGTPVQAALPALLASRHTFQHAARARIAENLARLDALVARRPEVSRLAGEGGWSAVLRLPARHSDEVWALGLLERGVAVHPGHFYDLTRGVHVVVSLLVEPRTFAEGIARLEARLAE